jgi:clan AA aspartic protease
MGTFAETIDVGDSEGRRFESVEAMVDTGSTYTWVPGDVLHRLGVEPETRMEFETADGRVIEREVAQTWVRHDGSAHITFVVFADDGATPLLGAYTLDGFGLAVDPIRRRLVPVRRLALCVPRARGSSDPRGGSRGLRTPTYDIHER